MKHPDGYAALDHYDMHSESDDRGELRALPEDSTPVHTLFASPSRFLQARPDRKTRQWIMPEFVVPVFLDSYGYERAACGKVVKVVLPMPFDDEDPDVCARCRAEAQKRAADSDAWDAARRQRDRIRREREEDRDEEEERRALWRTMQRDEPV